MKKLIATIVTLLTFSAIFSFTANAAWVDAKTILAIEATAKPAPYPVRALSVQTVKALRGWGFPVTNARIRYATKPLGTVEAYTRRKSEIVVMPRMQKKMTALGKCIRTRRDCSKFHYAAETLIHELLHTLWTGSPELDAEPDYVVDSYNEGLVEAVTIDLMPAWYSRIAKQRMERREPATYQGEVFIVQDESALACKDRSQRHTFCARRWRADLLRAQPSEWVRILERRT